MNWASNIRNHSAGFSRQRQRFRLWSSGSRLIRKAHHHPHKFRHFFFDCHHLIYCYKWLYINYRYWRFYGYLYRKIWIGIEAMNLYNFTYF